MKAKINDIIGFVSNVGSKEVGIVKRISTINDSAYFNENKDTIFYTVVTLNGNYDTAEVLESEMVDLYAKSSLNV